jgi:hypothetical protein
VLATGKPARVGRGGRCRGRGVDGRALASTHPLRGGQVSLHDSARSAWPATGARGPGRNYTAPRATICKHSQLHDTSRRPADLPRHPCVARLFPHRPSLGCDHTLAGLPGLAGGFPGAMVTSLAPELRRLWPLGGCPMRGAPRPLPRCFDRPTIVSSLIPGIHARPAGGGRAEQVGDSIDHYVYTLGRG